MIVKCSVLGRNDRKMNDLSGVLVQPPVKPGANNSRKSEAKSGSSGSRGNQQAEPVKPAEPVMPAAPSVDLLGLGESNVHSLIHWCNHVLCSVLYAGSVWGFIVLKSLEFHV